MSVAILGAQSDLVAQIVGFGVEEPGLVQPERYTFGLEKL